MLFPIFDIPPTRHQRQELLTQAEFLLFELAMAEPSGSREIRAELILRAREFMAELRARLLPRKGAN